MLPDVKLYLSYSNILVIKVLCYLLLVPSDLTVHWKLYHTLSTDIEQAVDPLSRCLRTSRQPTSLWVALEMARPVTVKMLKGMMTSPQTHKRACYSTSSQNLASLVGITLKIWTPSSPACTSTTRTTAYSAWCFSSCWSWHSSYSSFSSPVFSSLVWIMTSCSGIITHLVSCLMKLIKSQSVMLWEHVISA